MVAELGLVDLGHEGRTRIQRGKSSDATFWKQSLLQVLKQPDGPQVMDDDQVQAVVAALEDPSFSFVGSILFSAWGRRSA